MFRGELVRVSRPVLHQFHRHAQLRFISNSHSIASLLYPSTTSPKLAENESITVSGFVRSVRKQKSIAFIALGDGTTSKSLQVVLSPDLASGYVSPHSLTANCRVNEFAIDYVQGLQHHLLENGRAQWEANNHTN
jgi:hypothetical protein